MIEADTAGEPDPLGDYASAFALGRRMAGSPAPTAAPAAAPGPLGLTASVTPAQQQEVARRLEIVAGIARAIGQASPDPLERARLAQHFAQMHPELGIPPEQLTPNVMTNENLAQLQALASGAPLRPPAPPEPTHAARGFTILGVE